MKALMVDDIKLTVADFCIGQCQEKDMLKLQRYFIREYCSWMPFRAIAEQTGASDHSTVIQSIKEAKTTIPAMYMIKPLKKILDMKFHEMPLRRNTIVKWYPNKNNYENTHEEKN